MSILRLAGNIMWLLLGGFWMGLVWYLVGTLAFLSIIGIPWGRACYTIGRLTFWPFGKEAVSRQRATGRWDIGTGPLGLVGNVVWLFFIGWWIALGHLLSALVDAITIIGIPFAFQHLKLAAISLMPIGLEIVATDRPFTS